MIRVQAMVFWVCAIGAIHGLRAHEHGDVKCTSLPEISNVRRVSDRIISGGVPESRVAFRGLSDAGIRTIVSVDAIPPDAVSAAEFGMRSVHIPVGYDGISRNAVLSLIRVIRECESRVFVHCHHGVHRGPAAAAIAWRADSGVSADVALRFLQDAGTSPDYDGLWHAVRDFDVSVADQVLPQLVEASEVPVLASRMAGIGRRFSRLQVMDLSSADGRSLQEAMLLWQDFREICRNADGIGITATKDRWRAVEVSAGKLVEALRRRQLDKATRHLVGLKQQCASCHTRHR